MTDGFDVDEVRGVLVQRADVLRCIAEGPKYNRDLQEALGISRSTAYKALRSLEECSLIRPTDSGNTLTRFGRLALAEYREFHANLADLCRAGDLLSPPSSDVPVTMDVLAEAEVEFADSHAPHKPVESITRAIREAARFRAASPVVLPEYVHVVHEQIRSNDIEATILLERPVIEHLGEQYPEQLDDACVTTPVELLVTDRPIPFGLVIVDGPTPKLLLVVHGPNGDLIGLVTNTAEEAVEWGRETWSDLRAAARRFDRSDAVSSSAGQHP